VILAVRVIPRARKSAIAGRRGEAVLIRLAAPPVDGAANDALIDFLSKALQRPRRDISIVSGLKSRDKRVSIDGLSAEDWSSRLAVLLTDSR
jgi:hypothetical protein